jgi:CRISPR-associated protein Csd1
VILQALDDYYRRRCADPEPARRLAAYGLEFKEIGFVLELDGEGALKAVVDLRRQVGSRKVGTPWLVPMAVKRASGIRANLFWDNAEYVLALADPKKLDAARAKGREDEYRARLLEMQQAFVERIESLPAAATSDAGVAAVLKFLRSDAAGQVIALGAGDEIAPPTFRLIDDVGRLVSQRPGVAPHLVPAGTDDQTDDESDAGDDPTAMCLVSGELAPVARLHSAIKGVWGAQTSGGNIVSFNLDAFNSFGKAQGINAPVGRPGAFAYTTALNALLQRDSAQRLQVGDATAVFWAQRADGIEDELARLIGAAGDDPDAHAQQVRALYESIRSGAFDGARGDNRFFVLGLAPNAARLAVRFWHAGPLRELAQRIRQWFDDLAVARAPQDPQHPTLFALLVATAVQSKADNVSPHLAGDLMHSLLEGLPLPETALQAVVQRCRAEQARKSDTGKPVPNVNYARAALMKACINRLVRAGRLEGKEITVDLDEGSPDAAYQLGRLFAAYERIQADASGRDLNRSVRDAYFGSAMSNPASVFPRLIALNQIHMRDLRRSAPGLHVVRDRLLGEIWGRLPPDYRFPTSQPLAERARFALGYYHQREAFYAKADDTAEPNQPEGNA